MQLDHLILNSNDVARSLAFYTQVLGLTHEGEDGPFSVVRVTPDFQILLAPWGTKGGEHLAFAMSRPEFEQVFDRLRELQVPWGDTYHDVGNMKDPGDETGARGVGKTLYVFDPDQHLVEIRHYEA